MYKGNIELFRVNPSCLVKFGIIIKGDQLKFNKRGYDLISKFTMNGDEYFKVRPLPYITIDISTSTDKKDGVWNNNFSVNLNRIDKYRLVMTLKRMYNDFTKYKDLYVIQNNETFVNTDLSEQLKATLLINNKSIHLEHCIVTDPNTNLKYEGIRFSINKITYSTLLTYTELGYLITELDKIDMTALSLQLLSLIKLYEDQKPDKVEAPSVKEDPESEIIDTKTSIIITDPKQIPDI